MRLKLSIFYLTFLFCLSAHSQSFSVYLLGDGGEPKLPDDKNIAYLTEKTKDATEDDVLIFLGDNIYPKGLPDEDDPLRKEMEAKINPQLDVLKNFPGKAYIIPGNHDWAQGKSYGWKYIRNMEKYVTEYTGKEDAFQPKQGCPGPIEVPVSEKVTLIILDTQYFLHSGDKPRQEDGCEAGGTAQALEQLDDIVVRNAEKHIIVAGHHPMYSYGPHGSRYPAKVHLFPLTESKKTKNLYVPLPGLGTVYWFLRAVVGNIQDIPNPKYKIIRNTIVSILEKSDNVIWANGHEHSLQYIQKGKTHYVVSGSGSKTSHVAKGSGTQFFKEERGFAEVTYKDGKDVSLKFWGGDLKELLYEKELYSKEVVTETEALQNRPNFSEQSITTQASKGYNIGRKARFWLGENYRKVWETPVEYPYFDLLKEKGGLEVLKRGGGRQTLSIRMEAKDGRQYVLRSIDKDPSQLIPVPLRRSFAADFLQDQISSSYPYSALAIPKMADAIGVYHTNPKLVFVPDDPAFGKFQTLLANKPMLFEERPIDEIAEEKFFGEGDDIKGTLDLLDKELYDDNDNWVDQQFVLRSRLFDMVIGDWDRHDDQWRWVGVKNDDGKGRRYRPIPRDRDQAFFITNGVIPRIASSKWAVPSTEGFNEKIRWSPGFNWNMRWFDRTFLTGLEWSDWEKEVEFVQNNLTDESIDAGLAELPKEVKGLSNERIRKTLIARRVSMKEYARELYEYLSKEVEVVGTNKDEYFLVERLDDERTKVTVNKIKKKGDIGKVLYQRTFLRSETKEIRLYGLKGQDKFDLKGDVKKGIKVRIIGGKKKDEINNESTVKGPGKKTVVYDKKDNTTVNRNKDTKLLLSDKPSINDYNRKSHVYDRFLTLVSLQYNEDLGLFLGGGFFYTKYGWRKSPYAQQHFFLANGAVEFRSYNFKYEGRFTDVFGKWGLQTKIQVQEPFFIQNFFGFGNDSEFDFDGDNITGFDDPIDFYRVKLDQGFFQLNLTRRLGQKGLFSVGPVFRQARVDGRSSNRFIATTDSGVDPAEVAEFHRYTGVNGGLTFDLRDHSMLPTKGIVFDNQVERLWGSNTRSENLTRFQSKFSFFLSGRMPLKFVLANRVGVDKVFGNNVEFFNAPTLGGWSNLRGFRRHRFYGSNTFYHNVDLRIKLFSFTTYIFPGQFGILGFHDIGRVWQDGESPGGFSRSQGFGIWIAPLSETVISFNQGFTQEENLFWVRFGYLF